MAKRQLRQLTVKSTTRLTTNMQRVVLSAPSLTDFPVDCASGYIKLLFMPDGAPLADIASLERLNGNKPVMRTYTIRAFNAEHLEMTVDFVLHGDDGHSGPASGWAKHCQPGDTICIAGPGDIKLINPDAEWFFIAGDMTALPAISCNLEQLPADVTGVAIIEVLDDSDQQQLVAPEGMEIIWVIGRDHFLSAVRDQPWPEGSVSAWCACEFSAMREIRQLLKVERAVPREKLYISSYWKQGISEEEHKIIKGQDAEKEGA
ncbi:siderophore-interacting protein [Endozoicomonas elysicola]|uniref:Siderophore-interacting protein ViuB n=1 Tax=Endozoicomonas elysicola TaxID=305900 RepID=A0A081KE86_9GAMM|nr:siderophore-interacting protein [Endozoicomonas elysicola]KEI72462.1 siderophore-interacting protein ViuB [Endozoicomonas elysicola]